MAREDFQSGHLPSNGWPVVDIDSLDCGSWSIRIELDGLEPRRLPSRGLFESGLARPIQSGVNCYTHAAIDRGQCASALNPDLGPRTLAPFCND